MMRISQVAFVEGSSDSRGWVGLNASSSESQTILNTLVLLESPSQARMENEP